MKKIQLFLIAISINLLGFSQTTILTEDFQGGAMPAGWTQTTNGVGWAFGSNLSSTYWTIPSHTIYAASNDDGAGSGNDGSVDYLITPALDFSGNTAVILEFAEFMDGAYSESASVEVSTNGGSTWTNVYNIATGTDWTTVMVPLSAYAGQSNVLVGFHANDNGDWASGFAIDDVNIYEPAPYDVAMAAITTPSFVNTGMVTLQGTLQNMGAVTLTSVDVIWSIDGGTTTNTMNLTGLSVASASTYNFSHSIQIDMTTPQGYDVMCWVANPNGNTDSNSSNDQVVKVISSLSQVPQKIVVGEEAGGTWCGWCPRGIVAMKDMAHYYPTTWIGISVHNGDPMTNTTYDNAMGAIVSGYPSGMVDRAGGAEVDPGNFEATYQTQINVISPVAVDINNVSWNSSTRQVNFDVVATFFTNTSGNFRTNAVILEDGVTGTGSTWNQANYYSSSSNNIDLIDWEGINWKNFPNPVLAANMVYNDVAREILGGWAGTSGSIPSSVTDGTPNTHSYSYTVPAGYNENNMWLVGLVIDQTSGEILNGFKTNLIPTSVQTETKNDVVVYPNPTNNMINIANADKATIEVWNMLGQKMITIHSAKNMQSINLSGYQNGTYIVRIISENETIIRKINLIK